jgi:uncharacterized membrane protein YphA (DoxX/SURF4 family)
MRHVVLIARILLGRPFVVFGLNTVLWAVFDKAFMAPPTDLPAAPKAFLQALTDTGFMHPLRGAAELAGGLMVLTGFCTPLGLTVLAPVIVHIVLYHCFIDPDPASRVISHAIAALELFLAYAYGPSFHGVLRPRARSRWSREKARVGPAGS